MLQRAGMGFGALALVDLLLGDGVLAVDPARATPDVDATRPLGAVHEDRRAAARSVIFLFMGGAPSHVDTFDPKPLLHELHGQDVPESIARGVPRIARSPLHNLMASPFSFRKYGQSGIEVSELFSHVGQCVDELCVIRSCRHNSPIHAPAEYLSLTGTLVGDRPSLGSWLYYGLGSENRNLPGFIVLVSEGEGRPPAWSAGFLPSRYQGTVVRGGGSVPHLTLPEGVTAEDRQSQLTLLEALNRRHTERHGPISDLEARIRSYELAFRMQTAAPQVFDLSDETQETLDLYGVGHEPTHEFGRHCLLARRLVERGVRFVQLRNGRWDAHSKIATEHRQSAQRVDRPIAALLTDLKRRGLLEQTLVVWGGEFGRTPTAQGNGPTAGRDHSPSGYCMWLAGGGVQGGQVIGATDPVGYTAIESPVHPNDLHATILAALGIDQHALYYLHHNRREKVTVNGGTVVEQVFGRRAKPATPPRA
jgi:hypothetical protein